MDSPEDTLLVACNSPINYGIVTGDAHMKVTGRLLLILIPPNTVGRGCGGTEFHTLPKGGMVNPLDFPFQ